MRNAVVFTGLPRASDRFERSVSELSKLVEQGLLDRILFVTWEGYVDSQSALRTFLADNDVELIEATESPVGGHGNVWHQMKALDIGLDRLPADYRVLKTRTDVHIDPEFLRALFAGDIDRMQVDPESGVFNERVWVPGFVVDKPFYIFDYCFFGCRSDLKRLVNYDMRYEVLYSIGLGITERRRFIDPYIDEFEFLKPVIRELCKDPRNFIDRHNYLMDRVSSPVYGSALALYYKVLLSDFYVNYDPVEFKDGHHRPLELLSDETFTPNLQQGPTRDWYNLNCYRHEWLERQFGEPINQDVPDVVRSGIARSFDDWRTFTVDDDAVHAEARREREFIVEYETDYPGGQLVKRVYDSVLVPLGLGALGKKLYGYVSDLGG